MEKKINTPALRFRGFNGPWEKKKFGDLVTLERGGSPRPIDDYITNAPDGLNWVKIGDAPEHGNYITHTAEKIKPEGLSKTRQVFPGDLILSNSMSFGRPYIMAISGCIHDGWLRIADENHHFDLKYLCTMLGTPAMLAQYKASAAGSTVNNLNKDLVGNTKVVLPSIAEQKCVGTFLDDFDNVIYLHEQKIKKLEQFRQAMLTKLFPAEGASEPALRFRGFSGAWKSRSFADITFPSGERNHDNLPYTSYSITNERGFMPQDEKFENGGTVRYADKRMYFIVHPKSFAYNPARINIGSIGYQNLGHDVIVSSLYEIFQTTDEIDDRFLWHWFHSNDFQKNIERLQEGGVRLYFYYDKLCMCSLLLPTFEEQKKIGKFLDSLDDLLSLQKEKLNKLRQLKAALLDQLFV